MPRRGGHSLRVPLDTGGSYDIPSGYTAVGDEWGHRLAAAAVTPYCIDFQLMLRHIVQQQERDFALRLILAALGQKLQRALRPEAWLTLDEDQDAAGLEGGAAVGAAPKSKKKKTNCSAAELAKGRAVTCKRYAGWIHTPMEPTEPPRNPAGSHWNAARAMLAGLVWEGLPDRVSRPDLRPQRPQAEPSPKWRRHRLR